MTGKRFILENSNLSNARCNILDYGYGYTNKGLCDLLNELHKENEKLKKQLRELENDSTKSRNDREKNCGYCKNYNFDGMFGIWCSIHETPTSDKYCQDFEWNR